jgi:hypothetical protein
MKRVLLVGWSQSGQLDRILQRIAGPLQAAGVCVDHWRLAAREPYPFPWPFWQFFDVFPESVQLDAPPLCPPPPLADKYDLVILGYQVWFLSPSLPVSAFLQGAEAARLLPGTPVVAVVACRNMWMNAYATLRTRLSALGARLLYHVVLIDRGPTLASFITTPRWLLTGRSDAFLGMPPAGVAEKDVEGAARFGRALVDALASGAECGNAPLLSGLAAARVDPKLALSERAGGRAFRVWSRVVRVFGAAGQRRRRPALLVFVAYLVTLIVTLVPLSLLLQTLLRPLLGGYNARVRAEFEAPSGSGEERMSRYA